MVALGVDGLVIVETPDALLVMPKNRSQDTPAVVARLREMGRSEYRAHAKDVRLDEPVAQPDD